MDITAGRYVFGAQHGTLLLRTARTGLGSRAGHDLIIEATTWSGEAMIEPGEPLGVQIRVEVDVAGLRVVSGHGGIKPLTEHDRNEIRRLLRSDRLLHADKYPTIEYRSDSAAGTPESFRLEGHLTLAGTSHPLTVVGGQSTDGHLKGSATIAQTHWGIKPYTAFLGALKVADEVHIDFETTLIASGR